MDFSVGLGLTNACDLACAHCYRDTAGTDQLTAAEVMGVCDCLPVRSVNLGTGENGLHPEYVAIVELLRARGIKLSLQVLDWICLGTLTSIEKQFGGARYVVEGAERRLDDAAGIIRIEGAPERRQTPTAQGGWILTEAARRQ